MSSFLSHRLKEYGDHARLRLHMPGHGGELEREDVTELSETDDLLDPIEGGAIEHDEARCAALFGARATLFSAGGATLCLQTAIAFACMQKPDARVLCERGVHRSVLFSLAHMNVQPTFVHSIESLEDEALAACDIAVFSGCDYYGRVPDYGRLAPRLKRAGVFSVVDNAHGTHLRFWDGGRLHPLTYGFSLVVDSAHKTLPCKTGAALLHVGQDLGGDVSLLRGELLHTMRLFSTTSPSFSILVSLSRALSQQEGERASELQRLADRIRRVKDALSIVSVGQDPLRIALSSGFDFPAVGAYLKEAGIVPEVCDETSLVLLFPWNFSDADAEYLISVLGRALSRHKREDFVGLPTYRDAVPVLTLREALFSRGEVIEASSAVGRIAAEVVGRYPPGTALCLPGERLTQDVLLDTKQQTVRVVQEEDR